MAWRGARSSVLTLLLVFSLPVVNQSEARQSPAQESSPSSPASPAPQAALPSATPAQQQPAQQNSAPVYESATVLKAVTRLVVVDVVATDKKGQAVTDLTQSDFQVLEDGKEQKVRVFNLQQPAPVSVSAARVPAPAKLPENVYTNVPSYNVTNALNVVLLDALNTTMPNQVYVRDQMIHYLEKMPEGRPVAVYTLGTKLRLLQDFTTDPAVLKEVVRKLKASSSALLENPGGGPEQELLPPGAADSGAVSAQMLDTMMRFEQEATAVRTDIRVSYTLNALTALSRQLAGYPGRKNLVWVSEAFPMSIDPNMELSGDIFAGTRNYGPQIAAAADALIDSQIAIYPIDARGLVGSSVFSAANTGRDKFGRSMSRPGRMAATLSAESASLQATHGAMQDLAERTGGKAFYNRNDIDGAIRRSMDDGSTYYILAYYPENKNWNGKFRKIHVKVDRPGINLHYRLGYYAVDPKIFAERNQRQQTAIFDDAMSLETPVATALHFRAGVVAPSAATHDKVLVNFGLDPHAVIFETDSQGLHHAKVECAVSAFTTHGKYVKGVSGSVDAALKPETFNKVMRSIFPCQQYIDLPAGSYLLRIGVRDGSTGLMGTTNAKVTVSQAGAGANPQPGDKKL